MKMHRSKANRLASSQSAESDQQDRPVPDLSILRKSIQTSITGFTQARDVFDTGTEELKQLLTTECDVIYECKVCRNLFRSLANFISHKRVYCRQKFNTSLHAHFIHSNFIKDDMLAILQNEKDYQHYLSNKDNPKPIDEIDVAKKPLRQKKIMTKDLTSIIERLAQSKETPDDENNGCGLISQRISNLQTMSASNQAVYQNVGPDKITSKDSIQDEVAELDHMISSTVAVLGPDGKIVNKVTPTSLPEPVPLTSPVIQISDEEDDPSTTWVMNIVCKLCQMKFSTQKTLKFHMKHKHADNRLVYPCPDCADTFSNSWSVYRHLFKVHRKSAAHIRKLRDTIQNKAFRTSSNATETVKTAAPVVESLTDQQRLDQENQAWIDNFEGDEIPRCGGCGRRFERRAALSSHRQTCQLRIAAQNKIDSNVQRRAVAKTIPKERETPPPVPSRDTGGKLPKIEPKSEKKIEIKIRRDYNKGTAPSPSKIAPDFNEEDVPADRESGVTENGTALNLNSLIADHRRNSKDCNISAIIPSIKDSDVYVIVSTEVLSSDTLNGDEDAEESLTKVDDSNGAQGNNLIDDSELNLEDIQRICNVSDEIDDEHVKSEKSEENESTEKNGDAPEQMGTDDGNADDALQDRMSSPKDDESILNTSKSDEEIEMENNRALDNEIFKSPRVSKKLHCGKCNVDFGYATGFRKHMARHLDWKRFKCKDCGYRCFDRSQCIAHYKHHHTDLNMFTKKILPLNSTEARLTDVSVKEMTAMKESPEKITAVVELSDEESPDPDEVKSSSNATTKPANQSVIINNKSSTGVAMEVLELSDDDTVPVNNVSETVPVNNDSEIVPVNDNSSQSSRKRRKSRKPQQDISKKKIKLDDDSDSPIKDISAISPKQERRSANSVDPQKLFNKDRDPPPSISVGRKTAEKSESDRPATQPDAKNVKKADGAVVAPAPCAGRRPVRNRVKPLNKDFEYDLSNLMKLEAEAYKGSHSPAAAFQKQQLKRKQFLQKETSPVERPAETGAPKDPPATLKPPPPPPESYRGALQEASRRASLRGRAQIKNHPAADACRHHQPFIRTIPRGTALVKSLSEPTITSPDTPAGTTPLMKTNTMRFTRRPFIASMTSQKSSSDRTPVAIGPPPSTRPLLKRQDRTTETSPAKGPSWKIKSVETSPDGGDRKNNTVTPETSPKKISILRGRVRKNSPLRSLTERDDSNSVNIKSDKNNSSINSDSKAAKRNTSSDSDDGANDDKFASTGGTENNSTKISPKANKIMAYQNKSKCVEAMKLKMAGYLKKDKTPDKRSILLPNLKCLSKRKSLAGDRDSDAPSSPNFSDGDSASSFKLTVNTESICDLGLKKRYDNFSDKDLIEVEYHVDTIMSDEQENV